MRALDDAELVKVWERGLRQSPVQRALTLLAAACPDMPAEALAQLSIGERDARLLTLREWMFGSQLFSVVICPQCGERLDLTVDAADLRAAAVEPLPGANTNAESLSVMVADGDGGGEGEGYAVQFRLPNSLDLVAVANEQDVAKAQSALLERCVLSVQQDGQERAAGELPAEVVTAMAERMAQADPQADAQLAITCPACGHPWQVSLDIVSYLWSEIDAWAYRILREVHTLASAYGWSEADILSVSPWRRHCYLEMLGT